jgi:hypothetical protein
LFVVAVKPALRYQDKVTVCWVTSTLAGQRLVTRQARLPGHCRASLRPAPSPLR